MSRDRLLGGDEVDAFELGKDEVEVRKSMNAARTGVRNDAGGIPHPTPERPADRDSVRLVGDLPRGYGPTWLRIRDRALTTDSSSDEEQG